MPMRSLDKEELRPIQKQFLEGIVRDYKRSREKRWNFGWLLSRRLAQRIYGGSRDPNLEARALLYAIHKAFSGRAQREVEVYSSFISHLSSCVAIAMGYNLNQMIPWDRTHDKTIVRVLCDFMQILQRAIIHNVDEARQSFAQVGNIEVWSGEKIMYGEFEVPGWYIAYVENARKDVRRFA